MFSHTRVQLIGGNFTSLGGDLDTTHRSSFSHEGGFPTELAQVSHRSYTQSVGTPFLHGPETFFKGGNGGVKQKGFLTHPGTEDRARGSLTKLWGIFKGRKTIFFSLFLEDPLRERGFGCKNNFWCFPPGLIRGHHTVIFGGDSSLCGTSQSGETPLLGLFSLFLPPSRGSKV